MNMQIKTETIKEKYIMYDNLKFYSDKKGYWITSGTSKTPPKRLHIYVWEKHNGKIPEGYHVHHIDHNTDNNEIDNLIALPSHEHLAYHSKLQNKEKARLNFEINARPKAIEWHKSKEGSEWHKKHYEKTKHLLHKKIEIICINCGKKAIVSKVGNTNKYCSAKCKDAYRAKSGKDNVEKICLICGNAFIASKKNGKKYCSSECRGIARNENKKNRI